MTYTQVTLCHEPHRCRVAWIPTKFAVVGKILRLHDQDGWRVTSVGAELSDEFVLARRDDYRYQRRVSDV